jgi:hypothetical protein
MGNESFLGAFLADGLLGASGCSFGLFKAREMGGSHMPFRRLRVVAFQDLW